MDPDKISMLPYLLTPSDHLTQNCTLIESSEEIEHVEQTVADIVFAQSNQDDFIEPSTTITHKTNNEASSRKQDLVNEDKQEKTTTKTMVSATKEVFAWVKPCRVVLERIDGCVKPCSVILDRNVVLTYQLTKLKGEEKVPFPNKTKVSNKENSNKQPTKIPQVIIDSEVVTNSENWEYNFNMID